MSGLELELASLRKHVAAVDTEFDLAQRFHEAWKPMAYDLDLQGRVGRATDGNTFATIRFALRREMVLSLARIWDKQGQSIRMIAIGHALSSSRIINELVRQRADLHRNVPSTNDGFEDVPDAVRESLRAHFLEVENAFGAAEGERLRNTAKDATDLIGAYGPGGADEASLTWLRKLRDQYLAHTQLEPTVEHPPPKTADEIIERLYQDTQRLVRSLLNVVSNTDYQPTSSGLLREIAARDFWAGVHAEADS